MMHRSFWLGLAVLCACASPRTRTDDAGVDGGLPEVDAGTDADAGLDGGADTDGGELRVLFIGNSYTYVNDLPGTLAMIAATSGVPPTIRVAQVVQGGAALEDQWTNGIAQQVIADGGWTNVVVQGQSGEAVPLFCGTTFQVYARQFGELIEDAGAVPTWFVTWAYASGSSIYPDPIDTPAEMQDEVTFGYDTAARAFSNSLLACAGPAFHLAIAAHPEIVLQQPDFSHPTVAGTYLAACTFYVTLTGKPVPETSGVPAGLSAANAATLRDIATIGSSCANEQPKGIARLVDSWGTEDVPTPDGGICAGAGDCAGAFNYGITGVPIPSDFYLLNLGETTMQLSGSTLPASFTWTSGAYPGGDGGATGNLSVDCTPIPAGVAYCGDTLAPHQGCALSVSYAGESSSTGELSVGLGDAYTETAARKVSGAATDRALLAISFLPELLPCGVFSTCEAYGSFVFSDAGEAVPFTVFVGNRGAESATSMTGEPSAPPFGWAGGGFPGGTGELDTDAGTFAYCGTELAPGDFCVMTGQFLPTDAGRFSGQLDVSYSDSQGPVSDPADWAVQGVTPFDAGPPLPF